tara:strand:- start:209 stop:1294 length:1086 start_codon:yes stop_codon:yes gene_type:complete
MSQQTKYISFSPWWGGWNNQRMSYETAAAISILTGRKLILPYKEYCLFFSQHENKSTFLNAWNILDKNAFTKEFDCIDFFDVPEYQNLGNNTHYFYGIDKIAKCYLFQDYPYQDWGHNKDPSCNEVLVYNVEDQEDFQNFCGNRRVYDLNVHNKFIHFPRNLFSHFYYHVYGPNKKIRNLIKEKIGRGIVFKREYYGLAKKALNGLENFNAIHFRSGDFNNTHTSDTTDMMQNLKQMLDGRMPKGSNLYIATDEVDKGVFDCLKSDFKIYFRETFYNFLDQYEALALDHIIPAKADIFLGTKWSTFSDGIHIMRGFDGKKDFSREGINFKFPKLDKDILPWNQEQYGWNRLYNTHWTAEYD